jgi:predicted nucleotidyltransferase
MIGALSMSEKIYTIDEIKNVVAPIAGRYGVKRVCLFGSYAKGKANSKSDLDFIIDEGKIRGLQFAGMLGDLMDDFDKGIDLFTFSSLYNYEKDERFNTVIERDMVVIYEQ